MSAELIVGQVQAILQIAIPEATVFLGEPLAVNDPIFIYVLHQDYAPDHAKAGPSIVRRIHHVRITLLIMATGDEQQAERTYMGVSDRIMHCFYTNRLLNGQAQTSQIVPIPGGMVPYAVYQGGTYRHRRWLLDAEEYVAYVFA